MLRIEKLLAQTPTVLKLSGRIQEKNLSELRAEKDVNLFESTLRSISDSV
jgi:hypothetical protein